MIDLVLADLRSRFGVKVLLSPSDIEDVIGVSVGQQANLRSQNKFPIPYDKSMGKVVISIYDLAQYLANVGKSVVKEQIRELPDYPTMTRTQKKSTKGHLEGQWWLFHCPMVVAIISRSILDSELPIKDLPPKKSLKI